MDGSDAAGTGQLNLRQFTFMKNAALGNETHLKGFIGKFKPPHRSLIRDVRKKLRTLFPSAHELVNDNYNFFVIGYCSTERSSDCIVSLAASKNGVGLSFYQGAGLPDPEGVLEGSGSQNRFLRLSEGVKALKDARVAALIDAAEANGGIPLPKVPGYTVERT